MKQLHYNTVDGTVTLEYSRREHYDTVDSMVTLEHSSWNSYVRTQWMEQLG